VKTLIEIKLLADSIEYIALNPSSNLSREQTEHLANTHMTLQWVLGEGDANEQRILSDGFEAIVASAKLIQEESK